MSLSGKFESRTLGGDGFTVSQSGMLLRHFQTRYLSVRSSFLSRFEHPIYLFFCVWWDETLNGLNKYPIISQCNSLTLSLIFLFSSKHPFLSTSRAPANTPITNHHPVSMQPPRRVHASAKVDNKYSPVLLRTCAKSLIPPSNVSSQLLFTSQFLHLTG